MIQLKNMKLYTQVTDGIRYPLGSKKPFLIFYFPENSNLIDDFTKLNIKKNEVKIVINPIIKFPRIIMNHNKIKAYKNIGLISYTQKAKIPFTGNFIFDFSDYLNAIDNLYKPVNYRQKTGVLIKNTLNYFTSRYEGYEKILLYNIDITKNFNTFINRKFFTILQILKDDNFYFNHIIFSIMDEKKSHYRLLMYNNNFKLNRIINLLKKVSFKDINSDKNIDINKATSIAVNTVLNKKLIKNSDVDKIKTSINDYLNKKPKIVNKILSNKITDNEIVDITTSSILQNSSGNSDRSDAIVNKIPKNKKELILKIVNKKLTDQIIPTEKTISTSSNISVKSMNVPKMIDEKSPEHIFKKRNIDFKINLKKDMWNSFDILKNKDVPLFIESLNIVDKKTKHGELHKSDESYLKVVLKDNFGNTHNIVIVIPKINPVTGTFRINGQTKCLVNQIILCPITFPKPYDAKFESSYSQFHLWSKKTKTINYMEIYIASYKLPFLILLSYSFGFDKILNDYNIKYDIVNKKPKEQYFCRISTGKYIIFKNIDSDIKKELVNSFIRAKIDKYKINNDFGTKEYFGNLIIKITGKINSIYKIETNLENIIDPIAKQVLINQNLPTELDKIMKYMAHKIVIGYKQPRNDLTNQRIRNSEVLVHLAQKQILAAYTNFKEQILSGNKHAKFQIVPTKVMSDFINSEIVVNMEYGNPIEEMATLSKVSPVGKDIGGIPGKEAVLMESRNVHDTYFGNIDPLDTPEGANIGIVQQLTVDAYITSARGLIKAKKQLDSESSGILSTSTCLIPFIENNEGSRIIMAANQARQIVPLKNPEPPIVQSGYESVLTNVITDNFIKRSPCDGKIISINNDYINIKCKDGSRTEIDINPISLKSGSGKNTLSVFKTIVKENQLVKKNEIIAEGSCVNNGTISLGRTLTVAILPYMGYNYEDGVVINEKIVNDDKLTSLHLVEIEVLISESDRILSIEDIIGKKTIRGEPLLIKSIGEIEELIGFDEDDTSDISGSKFIKKSPGGRIADIEIFSNIDNNKFPKLTYLIERTNNRYKKPLKEKFTIRGKQINGIMIRFKIEQELKLKIGDKMANRYGNKGIVSLIEKDELMPRMPDGTRIDFIINPLGILNRMNVGQLLEMYVGLISEKLTELLLKTNNRADFIKLIKKIFTILDNSKNKENSIRFINNLLKLDEKQFSMLKQQIKNTKSFPIIIPPFKAPKFNMIKEALKELNLKTKYKLYLPRFNCYTKYECPCGKMLYYRLEHLSDMKIASRSTGAVVSKVLQPTSGKSRGGGQRLGEQETLSFISYGALISLQELLGPMSDDHTSKNEILSEIIETGHSTYKFIKSNPSRDLLSTYFISLMLSS